MHRQPFDPAFYLPSARVVAPLLLGHWLIRRLDGRLCGGLIVETEAYLADDPACHGAPGLTARNRVMFGPPGHAYVYLIYGLHFCVNAVCRPAGTAEAVLIRALEPIEGLGLMQHNRSKTRKADLASGPAKLCQALGVDRSLDGIDLCNAGSPLLIARNPAADAYVARAGPVAATRRIGITKAAHLPLRFFLKQSPFVSHPSHS